MGNKDICFQKAFSTDSLYIMIKHNNFIIDSKSILLSILTIVLLSCFGCGEIRRHKFLEPIATDHWKIFTRQNQPFERYSVAVYSVGSRTIEVYVRPLIRDQLYIGPIIPFIPNFFDNVDSEKKTINILITVSSHPPNREVSIEKLKIKTSNKDITTSHIKHSSFNSSYYEITIDYKEELPGTVELIFPEFGFDFAPPPLYLELRDKTKYRLLPPSGLSQ